MIGGNTNGEARRTRWAHRDLLPGGAAAVRGSCNFLAIHPSIIVILGVAGAGKTIVGTRISNELGWPFIDADDLQSPYAVRRLTSGRRLADQERMRWLGRVRGTIADLTSSGRPGIIAFPGLRQADRESVMGRDSRIGLVYLRVPLGVLDARVRSREHRFFNTNLLTLEFAALEEPTNALILEVGPSPGQMVARVRDAFNL